MTKIEPISPTRAKPVITKGAQALRAFRRLRKLDQEQFGAQYGLPRMTISRFERGEQSPELAQALQFQVDGICPVEAWVEIAQDTAQDTAGGDE